MKQLIFYALFWMFAGDASVCEKTAGLERPTFSKAHAPKEPDATLLKDYDVSHPIFSFK